MENGIFCVKCNAYLPEFFDSLEAAQDYAEGLRMSGLHPLVFNSKTGKKYD